MKDHINSFLRFFLELIHDRNILWGLAKNDFRARFASSFLGGAWSFIQPLVTMLVFWFVFQVGFKNAPVSGVPFIVWLAPAYLIWTFFADTLASGSGSLMDYSYLVKKVNFNVSMVPLVKIISNMFIHAGFLLFIAFLMACNGVPFSVYNLQLLYYFFCTCVLLFGNCWLFSALAPFVKDVLNLVNVFIQIGFWITPVFWSPDNMDPWVQNILLINPMFYVCRGYRDAVIDHVWFWERGITGWIFWAEALLLLMLGVHMFRKLRPQFADVI